MHLRRPVWRHSFVAVGCFAATCCSAPKPPVAPPPVSRPAPRPTPAPAPVPVYSNWMDAPATPGDWYYRRDSAGSRALFGSAGADARFAITCLPAQRRVTLARAGAASAPAAMTIRTETASRAIAGAPSGDAMPSLVATLAATDPLLDAIAFSKGRFAVEVAGQPTLYLPSWPEITRVIEDCRS